MIYILKFKHNLGETVTIGATKDLRSLKESVKHRAHLDLKWINDKTAKDRKGIWTIETTQEL